MAQINLNIPDVALPRVIAGICSSQNYTSNKGAGETQAQFAKRMIINQVKNWVKSAEVHALDTAANAQKTTVEQDIEANIAIT